MPCFKWSFLSLALLTTVLVAKPMQAQGPSVYVNGTEIRGYPEDWSHRHVVFSNIGAEDEALHKGEYEHWQKVVNEPRYVIQQLKNHGEVKGPARIDAEYRSRWNAESTDFRFGELDGFAPIHGWRPKLNKLNIKTDWSEALGGPGLAAGQYPAKFNYMTTTASCSDYVVFPTGATGSASHATIVAFNSVYSGCPLFSGGLPVVYWAYNTGNGYRATTSPTISLDGTQVAFVQTNGTTASLVLLKMAASGGTVGGPITPSSVAVGSYRACTVPCYTSISLGANDTASSPFYVFGTTDTLYVGDDSGKVHEVTGAFLGTPALDPSGWPATASTTTAPALTSPVYDSGSNRIFVTDAGGYLHTFTVAAPATVTTSGRLENNTTNVFGPPVVDSSAEEVYAFIGYSGDPGHTGHPSYINIFPAAALGGTGSGAGSGFGNAVYFANGGTNNPTTSNMRTGAFDNLYYEGTGTTGNLYVCENGVVYQVPLATVTATTPVVNTYSTPVTTPGTASTCAPVTEFLGTKAATTLSAVISTTTSPTVIHVTSGTNIANNDFLQIDSEIMQVSSGGGTTSLTVTRGQQGTTAATHANGAATQDIKDWLFTAVAGGASGNATTAAGCTGACVFNYQVMGAGTTGNPTAGLNSIGGTSGIVIDTSSTAINGDQEIYYTQLGGTSAIQASQAGLQ